MTSPIPGFVAPNPRTWAAGDLITTPRLRGDMTNLADLYAGGARPILLAQANLPNQSLTTNVIAPLYISTFGPLNTWNVQFPTTTTPNYAIPLAGWYLLQADITIQAATAASNQYRYMVGFGADVNGIGSLNYDAGSVPADGVNNDLAGPAGMELFQFNTNAVSGDVANVYAFTNNTTSCPVNRTQIMIEWVALPTSGLISYPGPYGTIVTSPVAAASFPSGQGTYITNGGGISAGATSMTVNDATGMIVNGTLGLDYINGQQFTNVAETVTITSVAGTTIGISATSYAHLQNAPVAVPVSYAFLNQQCRDVINFLAYPPLFKATPTGTQSIASSGFPPTVGGNPTNKITGLSISVTSAGGVDNFGGFAANAYTIPVAGVYLVYGQIVYAGSTTAFGCATGISVNGGTIQWGTLLRSPNMTGANQMTPTFRRLMRFAKNDVVTLWSYQGSGAGMNTVNSSTAWSKLIIVFRGF